MLRCLLVVAFLLLGLTPAGVGFGVWLAVQSAGWGLVAGSVAYAAVGVFALTADVLPNPPVQPVEVVR